jgi:aldose 1-epimerase
MRETIAIAAGDIAAVIVPSLGGGVARFDLIRDGLPIPIFRPWPHGGTDDPNDLGCYPLVPWSNRISGGGFSFAGRFHSLAANFAGDPNPIHGNGWTSSWSVTAGVANRVSLALSSDGPRPFRYDATLTYAVTRTGLSMALVATNRAEDPLPFGVGFHPWLPRTRETRLAAPAETVWREDSRHLPAGRDPIADHRDWDFSISRTLPAGWINNCFGGWSKHARIDWPERQIAVAISASARLSNYIVYSPGEGADFFCFEPVSHVVDAHNLAGGPEAHGLTICGPGGSIEADCRFDVILT